VNRTCITQILSLIVILILSVSAHSSFALASASQRQVVQAIQIFRSAKGPNEKVHAAEQVRNQVFATDTNSIDDRTLHAVASLLESDNDAVRYWIADALGHFSARAKFVVPKLRAILDERECMIAETSSVGIIRDALERIGEPAPERKCDRYILPK
jgi:hypothetical protein